MEKENILLGIFVIGVIGLLSIYPIAFYSSVDYETITVEDKETKYDDGTEKYLIFTDKGVYEVTDSFLVLHFSASDVYHELKRNETYNVKTYGWRIPFFSSYNNIVEVSDN